MKPSKFFILFFSFCFYNLASAEGLGCKDDLIHSDKPDGEKFIFVNLLMKGPLPSGFSFYSKIYGLNCRIDAELFSYHWDKQAAAGPNGKQRIASIHISRKGERPSLPSTPEVEIFRQGGRYFFEIVNIPADTACGTTSAEKLNGQFEMLLSNGKYYCSSEGKLLPLVSGGDLPEVKTIRRQRSSLEVFDELHGK